MTFSNSLDRVEPIDAISCWLRLRAPTMKGYLPNGNHLNG
jgi:hypothetical protein